VIKTFLRNVGDNCGVVQLKVNRRTRMGLAILGVGVVAVVIVITAKLGWTGFFPALAILAVGAWFTVRGHDNSGPRTMFAYCVALVVVFLAFGWLHPQRWAQPGWKIDLPGSTLLARHGGTVYFYDGGYFSARVLAGGQLDWRFRANGPKAILTKSALLVQLPGDPSQASKYALGTGRVTGTVPWPTTSTHVLTLAADGRITGVRSAQPRPKQIARMPSLGSGEQVIAMAGWQTVAARLVDARDPTGHKYTRLDIIDGKTSETFRVSGATGLQLLDDVLVVNSKTPHVIALIRHAPKKA